MAYENGVKVNSYCSKGYEKQKLKLAHMRGYGETGIRDFDTFVKQYEEENPEIVKPSKYWPEKYASSHKKFWHVYYISGRRKVAKWQSKKLSRASVRKLNDMSMEELEEVPTMTRDQEKKAFDYWWTVY